MEDIRTAKNLITPGSFMASIDLKDAFFMIPVAKEHRIFLRFRFKNQLFQFTCLPFGLCTSPFIFTKIMKPVMYSLRSKGLISCIYLDDILCIGSNYDICLNNVKQSIQVLASLGLAINYNKSNLVPSTRCKYLGFIIDSKQYSLELPEDKRLRLIKFIKKFRLQKSCKIRDFSQLVGYLVASCPAIAYGWVYCKQFEQEKYKGLLSCSNDYNQNMIISAELASDFLWWETNLSNSYNPIRKFNFKIEIYSDASLSGWGASCGNQKTQGLWNALEKKQHINHLELLAATLALKCFASHLSSCEILLRIDNTTAISYINRGGGVKYPSLSNLAKQIWQWCEAKKIWIFASYIPSSDNIVADEQSRNFDIDTEWELSNTIFREITVRFGTPSVDLFASRINKKCNLFYSWHKDPEAKTIDAFTTSWSDIFFYAFPPFSLILRTLKKILADEATGILVVPFWPTQPWYPLFVSLLTENLLKFEPSPNLLLSPCRSILHPLWPQLTLAVGKLSGKRI